MIHVYHPAVVIVDVVELLHMKEERVVVSQVYQHSGQQDQQLEQAMNWHTTAQFDRKVNLL